MDIFNLPARIVITCNKRLSMYLEKEVTGMGFRVDKTFVTGVELKGTVRDCMLLNMNLRTASQVLYSLTSFPCDSPERLYDQLLAYPWEKIISPDGYFTITSHAVHFTVNNELFVNVKVKDAIADRMRREAVSRPDSGPDLDKAVFHLYWKDERAEIFLDTSGETPAKHGYRKIPGKAPMLEALAAATLMATRWDGQTPLVNPMCGSGTVAIEAVMLATNRRPGLYRKNYSFMHVLGYDESAYQAEARKLRDQVIDVPGLKVIASDLNPDAIDISRINAGVAGVESFIDFQVCDFEETDVPPPPGLVFLNPEYGERMGDVAELETTYARIGDFLKKKCQGYTGYIFTGNLDLAKKVGLKASRRIEFYSAKLDCRLLEYEMYAGSRRPPLVPTQQ